jgi:hypothetical protein
MGDAAFHIGVAAIGELVFFYSAALVAGTAFCPVHIFYINAAGMRQVIVVMANAGIMALTGGAEQYSAQEYNWQKAFHSIKI